MKVLNAETSNDCIESRHNFNLDCDCADRRLTNETCPTPQTRKTEPFA